MAKAKLNKCEICNKTYNLNEVGTTENYCCNCNEKRLNKIRRKDNLRKKESRSDKPSLDLEKLAKIEE